MLVVLTPEELADVRRVAMARQGFAQSHGIQNKYGATRDELASPDFIGRFGEVAASKALGLPSDEAVGRIGGPDVGKIQVRSTERNLGSLIVHPRDSDSEAFLLVIVHETSAWLAGWIRGSDAKQQRFWRTDVRAPAYFVPQRLLRPVRELLDSTLTPG